MKNIIKKINFSELIIILISFFVSICALIGIALGIESKNDNIYDVYATSLSDTEYLSINDIYIDDSRQYLYNYEGFLKFKDKKLILEEDVTKEKILSIKVSSIENIRIVIRNKKNAFYKLQINKNGKKHKILLINNLKKKYIYEERISTVQILKKHFSNMNLKFIFAYLAGLTLLFCVSLFMCLYVSRLVKRLIQSEAKIYEILLGISFAFILNFMYVAVTIQMFKWLVLLPTFFVLICILCKYKNSFKNKLDKLFVIISMFIGTLMILIMPPLHVPDEASHMIRSVQMSYTFQDKSETQDKRGLYTYTHLPYSVEMFIKNYGESPIDLDASNKYQSRTYIDDVFNEADYNNRVGLRPYGNTKYSSPFPYAIGAITFFVLRNVNTPMMIIYLLTKLITLMVSIVILYHAIKIAPRFKKVLFIVSLLPIFMQQVAAYNMDWLTNVISILFVAMVLKAAYGNSKIDLKYIIKLMIVLVLLGLSKFGYFPLAILLFTIPKNKFKNEKTASVLKFGVVIFAIAFSGLVYLFYKKMSMPIYFVPSTKTVYSFDIIYKNPIKLAKMLLNTFKMRLDLDLFRGFVTGFGWSTLWISNLAVFISMALLLTTILANYNSYTLSIPERIKYFIVFVLQCGVIYSSMLFTYCSIDYNFVDGLQPRYFIPACVVLYILMQNRIININIKRKELFFAMNMIIVNLISMIEIITGFYY